MLDTTKGRLKLTSAAARNKTQAAVFFSGVFQIKQRRAKKPVTELALRSRGFSKACAASAGRAQTSARRRSRKVVARLWGDGKGRFRTSGRKSAATVKGTKWLVEERCDGTLTRVTRGTVVVRDFRLKRNVVVRAGRRYLAR